MVITFQGIVQSRSSTAPSVGPPGEDEVLSLNPQRHHRILQATGWQKLFPGTLNLEVEEKSVHQLLLCTAKIRERAEDVRYPKEFAFIPQLRVGYLYYSGRLKKGNKTVSVLIRRACNPLRTRLEAFSEEKLRDCLDLSDGEMIVCEIDD